MDHMTGLHALRTAGIKITNFWDTQHSVVKSDTPNDWEGTKYDMHDWQEYKRLQTSTTSPKALHYVRNDQFQYFAGDGLNVWGPTQHQLHIDDSGDINALSYVLFIRHGECNILLGGDAPESFWKELYDLKNWNYPKVHLLKAPHHGRKSGYHWPSVKAMNPDYTVVSVGELKSKDDAFASYEKYSVKGCYSMRYKGNITAQCWLDGDVWLYDAVGRRLP